jgi:large subunit ribosomal protein L3
MSLKIQSVDAERGLLLIRGAVPGPDGGLVLVRSAAKRPSPGAFATTAVQGSDNQ